MRGAMRSAIMPAAALSRLAFTIELKGSLDATIEASIRAVGKSAQISVGQPAIHVAGAYRRQRGGAAHRYHRSALRRNRPQNVGDRRLDYAATRLRRTVLGEAAAVDLVVGRQHEIIRRQ